MDPAAPVVQVGDLLASKYRVERVLGQGGMGVVVAARHEQLGFQVALKFMLPTALGDETMKERFLREARAAGSLRSEHVARVMDYGTLDDGAPYIVMEFLQGSDLQEVQAKVGALPPHEAALYVLQACKGMEEAHAQGIVHRDLKPQNLFLTCRPDGTPLVKVLDFGISKVAGTDTSLSVTASSTMMGSPLYMAPEQVRSAKRVDARADIYSLGAILYQLVTGSVPIPAETLGELFEALFTRATPPPRSHRPELSPELDAVIMRCLAKAPEERFETVGQLAAALLPFTDPRRSLAGLPVVTQAPAAGGTLATSSTQVSQGGGVLGPTTTAGAVSDAQPEVAGLPARSGRGRAIGIGVVAGVALVVGAVAGFARFGHGTGDAAGASAGAVASPGVSPAAALPSAVLAPIASGASASAPSASAPGAASDTAQGVAPSASQSGSASAAVPPSDSASSTTSAASTPASRGRSHTGAATSQPHPTTPAASPSHAHPAPSPTKPADPFSSPD